MDAKDANWALNGQRIKNGLPAMHDAAMGALHTTGSPNASNFLVSVVHLWWASVYAVKEHTNAG